MAAQNEALDNFICTFVEFLDSIADAYSTCSATVTLKKQLKTFLKVSPKSGKKFIIKNFHNSMKMYYTDVARGDLHKFRPGTNEMLDKVHFIEKWKKADDETKEIITEYVQNLCKLSQTWSILSQLPPAFSDKITGIAEKVASGMKDGKGLDFSGIDLAALGEECKKNVNIEDVMGLAQTLNADGSLTKILSQVGATGGTGGAGVARSANGN